MAYVLSSVSGNLISAASAGFAPTNSADVSAIASAYQVVSATATQLYAGTAYVTSINEAPVSASRAGNAANASLANSAWYDGTGRLISALPDNAAVSAIASSYVESGVSGKQDTLSFAYNTADQISSINGSALGGMDETAVSGIASAYAESAASSKQDTLTFGYDAEDKISSIDGSALAGEGGGLVTAIGTSDSGITSLNNFGLVDTAALHSADYSSLYVQEPLYISASGDSSYIGISGNVGGVDSATCSAIASAYAESAASSKLDSSASSSFYGIDNPSGFLTAAYAPTFGYNTADQISSIDGSALGGMDEAAVSSIASAYAENAISSVSGNYYTTANESGFITGVDLTDYATTAYVDSAVSSKVDSSALSSYVPYSSLEYNTASAISGINGSALAAGSTYSAGEGIDITDDVISVETPVDIVAGPGIVIDNPDGNTLRVSMASNYETLLYSHSAVESANNGYVYVLSEPVTNFDRIRVECWNREFKYMRCNYDFTITDSDTSTQFIASMDDSRGTGNRQIINLGLGYNSSGNLVDLHHGLFYGNGSQYTSGSNRGLGLHKVYGINRTASAQ